MWRIYNHYIKGRTRDEKIAILVPSIGIAIVLPIVLIAQNRTVTDISGIVVLFCLLVGIGYLYKIGARHATCVRISVLLMISLCLLIVGMYLLPYSALIFVLYKINLVSVTNINTLFEICVYGIGSLIAAYILYIGAKSPKPLSYPKKSIRRLHPKRMPTYLKIALIGDSLWTVVFVILGFVVHYIFFLAVLFVGLGGLATFFIYRYSIKKCKT